MTIEENRDYFSGETCWSGDGDSWSESWGGVYPQWVSTILPRIMGCLPVGTILDLGCGRGRWTPYLLPLALKYIGIDVSNTCINRCKSRWPDEEFLVNDGRHIPLGDGDVDLVFSFDSLPHCEVDAMEVYIPEILRVLSPRGKAFVHHSNMMGIEGTTSGMRATTVNGDWVITEIDRHGGRVILSERHSWLDPDPTRLIDCFTLFEKGPANGPIPVIQNTTFQYEVLRSKQVIADYLCKTPN